MSASLADQDEASAGGDPPPLAIALGANLPSPAGEPLDTLVAVRPLLTQLLQAWAGPLQLCWSPLFRTEPEGGPADQPAYLNAVLLVTGAGCPSCAAAQALLAELFRLEQRFGRQRRERWGPRSLDLDLLWWGVLRCSEASLELPHPRWRQRAFVLAPLAAIAPALVPPGQSRGCAALLAALEDGQQGSPPEPLAARLGWPEGG
ncbi:MAG: 2-amino-4-hydroxy-6-hydroxymethyldihydropteridine diphosphokinase [Prochlorococcaceae cyanobacterium]